VLTEQVYDKLAPWSKSHPNFGLYRDDDVKCCTVCGSENVYRDGHAYTQTGKFQRYKCGDCGKYLRSRKNVKDRDNLLTNVM